VKHLVRVTYLHGDPKRGAWFMLTTRRQQVEVRVTPSGLFRVGIPEPLNADAPWADWTREPPK